MVATVEIQRSLKSGYLKYSGTFWQRLWIQFESYIGGVATVIFLYISLKNTFIKDHFAFGVILLIVIVLFIGISAFFVNKIYIVPTSFPLLDADHLKIHLKSIYDSVEIDDSSPNLFTATQTSNNWKFERIFTVFIDDKVIALNLSCEDGNGMKYTLCAIGSYYKCRRIVKTCTSIKTPK